MSVNAQMFLLSSIIFLVAMNYIVGTISPAKPKTPASMNTMRLYRLYFDSSCFMVRSPNRMPSDVQKPSHKA